MNTLERLTILLSILIGMMALVIVYRRVDSPMSLDFLDKIELDVLYRHVMCSIYTYYRKVLLIFDYTITIVFFSNVSVLSIPKLSAEYLQSLVKVDATEICSMLPLLDKVSIRTSELWMILLFFLCLIMIAGVFLLCLCKMAGVIRRRKPIREL